MADLGNLLDAATTDELHRALVLFAPACQEREPALAVALFRGVHEGAADGAAVTALLLMTDDRWSVTARPVAARLEATGLVPDDELDLLARAFVAAGDTVHWACPADWFDGPEIVIAFDDDDDLDGEDHELPADDREVVVARRVTTGLRRWAAARLVRSDPGRWGALLGLARSLGGARGGAVMLGLLDERTILTDPAARLIETAALQWTRRDVRAAANRRVTSMPRARPPADDAATTTPGPADAEQRAPHPSLF